MCPSVLEQSGLDRRRVLAAAAALCAPAAGARAAPVEPEEAADFGEPLDVASIAPGDWKVFRVAGDPVFVRRRTLAEIAQARARPSTALADPARDEDRASGDGQWLVVSGLCTHAACRVVAGLGPYNGWTCFCHGSVYDLSGRVRHGPAKRNLALIRHQFRADHTLVLLAG